MKEFADEMKEFSDEEFVGEIVPGGPGVLMLSTIAPAYASFLYYFPTLMNRFDKKEREEKFEIAYVQIKKHYETPGLYRRLSIQELMRVLEDMKPTIIDNPKECLVCPILPPSAFFDSSEPFFMELRKKLLYGR